MACGCQIEQCAVCANAPEMLRVLRELSAQIAQSTLEDPTRAAHNYFYLGESLQQAVALLVRHLEGA